MKKFLSLSLALMLVSVTAFAAEFAPTLLKLSADPVIQYDFDGSQLEIPIVVSGATAGVIFSVFTKDSAQNIPDTINGYLGWHHVNKIDTCVYYSNLRSVGKGANTITWNGMDQDGAVVPAGEYTYYLWAFDNQSNKQLMCNYTQTRSYYYEFQEVDESGLPMANPLYYELNKRWIVGTDPMDSTMVEETTVNFAQGWSRRYTMAIQPDDFDYFYVKVLNGDAGTACITKWKWVPGGDSEFQADFGIDGYSEAISTPAGGSDSGVCTDGTYLFTSDRDDYNTDTPVDFFIFDMDGYIVSEIDLQKWWSSLEDREAGAQANGGPNGMMMRNGKIFLNCHCSCLKQMVDPYRFLDSGESDDFFVWTNGNGDYVLDHNFEDTAALPWVCMDYNVGPYTYNIDADDMLFSQCPAYDVGAVSFGLMAPDGTGLGYFSFAGETAGWKKGSVFIDSETPFDGMYCDNEHTGGPHYDWCADKRGTGLYFIGHDAISGVITNAVSVENDAPAAFAVEQNVPNPFNPTTTIAFTLTEAGAVSVDVFNIAGQKVAALADGFMEAGHHEVRWDASEFSAGVYFYTVKTAGNSKTMKMTLIK